MSDGFAVKIEGLDDVIKRMREASSKVEKRVAAAAVRAAAKPVTQKARALVPTGPTGQLRKSIGVKVKRYRGGAWAGVGPRHGFKMQTPDGKNVDPANYAHLVERGTRRSRATPFLRPAIDSTRTEQFTAFANKAAETFTRLDL